MKPVKKPKTVKKPKAVKALKDARKYKKGGMLSSTSKPPVVRTRLSSLKPLPPIVSTSTLPPPKKVSPKPSPPPIVSTSTLPPPKKVSPKPSPPPIKQTYYPPYRTNKGDYSSISGERIYRDRKIPEVSGLGVYVEPRTIFDNR